ncbi:DUF6339 family protein [Kitasatospora purpeofusca]|uniref:DUF6339 family protein n=1 Tax=Kitasatospora purpeofusca TaxID=67352 RepID=UPI002A5A328B|nr:DUF6339 family protein [Kitasatospora purpeofusca]MDY0810110.1 DUF6339 family protein [Kitasatospora purpeofusca]
MALLRASEAVDDDSGRWDTAPVRELLDEAIHRFGDSPTDADAWLSPRLHATLRLTRAEAARPGLWNFLALVVAPDYVLWRHLPRGEAKNGEPPKVSAPRFTGTHYTQAFARLWWAAELFRDGGDYRPVEIACRNQDMLNTAMRLDAIDHRPTALAMVRVLKGLAESGATRLGDRVNALCTAVNAAGSTLMYDVIAQDDLPDPDALLSWVAEADTAPSVPWDRLPDGPSEEAVRRDSVDRLARMFQQFSEHAPLRDRGRKRDAEATS